MYDPEIHNKIYVLGRRRFNKKVVYYGLNQGIDFRLLDKEMAELLCENRFGIINNKGNWVKGIKLAWDGVQTHEKLAKETIDLFVSVGYIRKQIQVFVLILWKISYEICVQKANKLYKWGVKIDDCTWNSNKKTLLKQLKAGTWSNPFWTAIQYKDFRKKSRKHNQIINFNGYDPEQKKIGTNPWEKHT